MRVIAVDDEPISLDYLTLILSDTPEIDEVVPFKSSKEALSWLKDNHADIAFLDIMMSYMDGLKLAEEISNLQEDCHVVFVTGSTEFALDAFKVHAAGYILKPASVESVRKEIAHIEKLSSKAKHGLKPLRAQCFGNFDIFYKDVPLKFKYSKSKELLAYLIHRRGVAVTVRELVAVLYEDRKDSESLQSQLRTLVSDLSHTLNEVGCGDVLSKARGTIAVVPDKLSCDYFDYMAGSEDAARTYMGEYMAQYVWADYMAGRFDMKKNNI